MKDSVKKAVDSVKDEIYAMLDSFDGDTNEELYAKYGDIEDFDYDAETGVLYVDGTSKAYGDSHSKDGEVSIMSDSTYRLSKPRYRLNWRGERTINVSIEYAANSVAQELKARGLKVSSIKFHWYFD